MADTTFRIVGRMSETGCKSHIHFYDVSVETPYPHEVQLMVLARPDQDCDAFIEALEPAYADKVEITMHLKGGELVCGTDDLKAVEA